MNTLESLFPARPAYEGSWQAIYLEPIVGSGEQIVIAVAAFGKDSQSKVIQAIRTELLDCLYGSQSSNIQAMIDWVIDSARSKAAKSGTLKDWLPPFSGVKAGAIHKAADDGIDGILRQAVRFSASLSTLALDADRENDEEQPRRYAEQWTTSVVEELKLINPHLSANFKKQIKVSGANVLTAYGYLTERYVSNFGLLVPSRLGSSLNAVKAKLFDLEILKKSNILIKPEKYEIIVGTPSLDDPTLTEKTIKRLKETAEMVSELAEAEDISFFKAVNAREAALHLLKSAA